MIDMDSLREQIVQELPNPIIDKFHKLFYESRHTWISTTWRGVNVLKSPLDLWMYQELIYELKPDLIIETGTACGGSSLYFADILNIIGNGRIITVDIEDQPRQAHPRVECLTGSSVDKSIIKYIGKQARASKNVMVILDSDHSSEHVYKELMAYQHMVTFGNFLVVEDTNLGVLVQQHVKKLCKREVGPHVAIKQFLKENSNFMWEPLCERFFVSFNQGGWLRRVFE